MIQSVVIDTNAYSAYKRGDENALKVIKAVESIVFSPTVLGELLAGFELGKKSEQNRKELEEFLNEPKVLFLTINAQTAKEYSKIYKNLRQQGTPIPTNDMWIAAIANQLDMAVFTHDTHFTKIDGLQIVQSVLDLG